MRRPPSAAPSPPPMVNSGASVPPEVPLPSEIDQETNFSTHEHDQRAAGELRRRAMSLDVVVADAQRARREVADDADRDGRRAPATTSSGWAGCSKRVLDGVDRRA